MNRFAKLIDISVSLIEIIIERIGDPSRERFLRHALERADHKIAELSGEVARLERENSALIEGFGMLNKTKQVIVMRTDLNMRKGKMIAQGAHASIGALELAKELTPMALVEWSESGTAKICVGVDSEQKLLEIKRQADASGLPVYVVTDSGRTEFNGVPTRTCLAIGPCWSISVDPITGGLKLL